MQWLRKRKYNNEYISLGFIVTVDRDDTEKSQCFLCGKVLANSSMKPVKLKDHLISNHPGNVSDNRNVFLQKKARFERGGTLDKQGLFQLESLSLKQVTKLLIRLPRTKGRTLLPKH